MAGPQPEEVLDGPREGRVRELVRQPTDLDTVMWAYPYAHPPRRLPWEIGPEIRSALVEWIRGGFGQHTRGAPPRLKPAVVWVFRQHPESRAWLRLPSVREDVAERAARGDGVAKLLGPGGEDKGRVEMLDWIAMYLDDASYQWFLGAPTQWMCESLDPEAKRHE